MDKLDCWNFITEFLSIIIEWREGGKRRRLFEVVSLNNFGVSTLNWLLLTNVEIQWKGMRDWGHDATFIVLHHNWKMSKTKQVSCSSSQNIYSPKAPTISHAISLHPVVKISFSYIVFPQNVRSMAVFTHHITKWLEKMTKIVIDVP